MIDVAEKDVEIAISHVMVALNDEYQIFMIVIIKRKDHC